MLSLVRGSNIMFFEKLLWGHLSNGAWWTYIGNDSMKLQTLTELKLNFIYKMGSGGGVRVE